MSVMVEPFPDETIKSWLSRLQHISCERVKYASSNLAWARDLPLLDTIIQRWSAKSGVDYNSLKQRLEDGHTYSNLEKIIFWDGGAVGRMPSPRMCNDCIVEDITLYGVAYTHRSHNFPGVDCCHLHSSPLLHYCSVCNTDHSQHSFWNYYDCQVQIKEHHLPSINAPEVDVKYAGFIYDLLHAETWDVGRDSLRNLINKQSIYIGIQELKTAAGWCIGAQKYTSDLLKTSLKGYHRKTGLRTNAVSLPIAAKYTFAIFKDSNYLERLKFSIEKPDELFPFPPKDENGYDYLVAAEKIEILALLERSTHSSKQMFIDDHFIIVTKVRFWDQRWLRITLNKHF